MQFVSCVPALVLVGLMATSSGCKDESGSEASTQGTEGSAGTGETDASTLSESSESSASSESADASETSAEGETDRGETDTGDPTDDPTDPSSSETSAGSETGADESESGSESGADESETGADETGETGDGFDSSERCPDAAWRGDELPAVILDTTIGRFDDVLTSCGEGAAPDYQLDFRAPWTGTFVFDTAGSSFDTVVSVQAGACEGKELACNDDTQGVNPEVTVELTTVDPVLIIVDTISSTDAGDFTLSIEQI